VAVALEVEVKPGSRRQKAGTRGGERRQQLLQRQPADVGERDHVLRAPR